MGHGGQRRLQQQFLHAEVGFCKGFQQPVHRIRSIRRGRLFDRVMEQMPDEGPVGGLTADSKGRHIARFFQTDGLPIIPGKITPGVDRFAIVLGAPASNRIEILQAEAQGIDGGVAAHAGRRPRDLRDLLPHGEGRVEIPVLEFHGLRRRLELAAHDIPREEYPAVDR